MLRGIAVILGLATMVFGAKLIATDHSKDAVCNASHGHYSALGMNSDCLNVVSSYFAGFALVVVGLLVVVAALVMKKRLEKSGRTQQRASRFRPRH